MLTESEFEILVRNEITRISSANNIEQLKINFVRGGNIHIYRLDGDLDEENKSKIKEKLDLIAEISKQVIGNKTKLTIYYKRPNGHEILEIVNES
jgi:hypothetical protein